MDEYKQSYLILWRAIEEAVSAISAQNFGLAAALLKQAQLDTEEAYISLEM